ncbi:MAG: hypothetical protein JXR05_10765 [Flavobacteriaceae bacterium]
MKKAVILITILLFSITSIGQEKVKISLANPSPRIGDEVTLNINVDFFSAFLKKAINKDSLHLKTFSNGYFSKTLSRKIIFDEVKEYVIGPFSFEFNGYKYTTNTITVSVLPELPIKAGLWLRHIESDGEQYIIIEQHIKNISNKPKNVNGSYSYNLGGVKPNDKEFAELNKDLTNGIELYENSSATKTVTGEITGINTLGFSYSMKKYKVIFDKTFKGSYKVSKKDFKNLPKRYNLDKVKLKK